MTTFQTEIYYTFSEVESFWNQKLDSNNNLFIEHLAVVEQANLDNIVPIYVIIKHNNKIIAQLYGQLFTFSPRYIKDANIQNIWGAITRLSLNCMKLKLLVIGHLFRHDTNYYWFDESIKDKPLFFSKIIIQLQKEIKHHAIFLKDLPEYLSLPFATNTRYQSFENDISMQLNIANNWLTFSDYENALKKKYAKRLRHTIKQFEGVTISELSLADVEKNQLVIYNLYEQVVKNQSLTFGMLNKEYFVLFKKQMGDNLKIYGYYYNKQLIAFSSAIMHNGVYDMNYIGFDYTFNNKISLYFNILFCCIQNAIDQKCHTLVLGRTALEAKAILGCKPISVKGYYKINNLLFSEITKRITNKTAKTQGDMWMNRHPFKNDIEE